MAVKKGLEDMCKNVSKLAYIKNGLTKEKEIKGGKVCDQYVKLRSIDGIYGDTVCQSAWDNHFKGTELFKDAKWSKKAYCRAIVTHDHKEVNMAICGYISEKNSKARFCVTNAYGENVHYYFETEDIFKNYPTVIAKNVGARWIPPKEWEPLEKTVLNRWNAEKESE